MERNGKSGKRFQRSAPSSTVSCHHEDTDAVGLWVLPMPFLSRGGGIPLTVATRRVPIEYPADEEKPGETADIALPQLGPLCVQEIESLTHFNKVGCSQRRSYSTGSLCCKRRACQFQSGTWSSWRWKRCQGSRWIFLELRLWQAGED